MVRHEPRPAWCGSSCRQGARQAVKPELFNISATFCPRISHGLYALHADMKANPKLHLAMDLNVIGKANEVCAAVRPPLPLTHVCVHPPETDRIISKGIVWRGHWASDCNEEYRLRTLCAIVSAVRSSGVPRHRAWVLDVGASIGTFTLPLVAAGVNVVAFEADPDNVALLNGSLVAQRHLAAAGLTGTVDSARLGRVHLIAATLSASGGPLCTRQSGLNMGPAECRMVRTKTLDGTLFTELGLPLGGGEHGAILVAAKIDVQGTEAQIFAGAKRLLKTSPPARMYIETSNTSLVHWLRREHGYLHRSVHKDGCDYNVHLRLQSGGSAVSMEDVKSPPPPSPAPPSPPPPPTIDSNLTKRLYDASCIRDVQLSSSQHLRSNTLDRLTTAVKSEPADGIGFVPRLVHQTWKNCTVPQRQMAWWMRCARLSAKWSFHLWTDAANRAFVARNFAEHLAMYDGYNVNIKRVDAIRYFLLYTYGGVYMDLDFACVRSLETLPLRDVPGRATLVLQRKSAGDHEAASNAFMAAPAKHPFFRYVISQLPHHAHHGHVLDATGPRFLTKVWRSWVSMGKRKQVQAVHGDPVEQAIDSPPSLGVNYAVEMSFRSWALLHRVHSCRPEGHPGPPCSGPYNYAPCKKGSELDLDRCARMMPQTVVTTFWTATWLEDHPNVVKHKMKANASVTTGVATR